MRLTIASLLLSATILTGCLENDEDIVIRPNGSVEVRVSASGKARDLADGYPVPLEAPWIPEGEDTRTWIDVVGRDSGSREVQAKVGASPFRDRPDEEKVTLAARATFDSVKHWPEWFAPAAESYRTAYVRRTAGLSIERKGPRTIYQFERIFHRRPRVAESAWNRIGERIPKDIHERLEQKVQPDAADWARIVPIVSTVFQEMSEAFARDSLLGVYTLGDATLSVDGFARILGRIRPAVSGFVTTERLKSLHQALDAHDSSGPDPLERFEDGIRGVVRQAFEDGLAAEGVRAPVRNAIRERLEWNYTAFDHTADLGAETFQVHVTMPGIVVGGNYDRCDSPSKITWSFKGEALLEGDAILRVVSILE